MPFNLRSIYIEFYCASLTLDDEISDEVIYKTLKASRIDELISYKKKLNCYEIKKSIEGDVDLLDCYLKGISIKKLKFYLFKAIDFELDQIASENGCMVISMT